MMSQNVTAEEEGVEICSPMARKKNEMSQKGLACHCPLPESAPMTTRCNPRPDLRKFTSPPGSTNLGTTLDQQRLQGHIPNLT